MFKFKTCVKRQMSHFFLKVLRPHIMHDEDIPAQAAYQLGMLESGIQAESGISP